MSEENISYNQQRLMRKNGLLPPLPTKKERKPLKKQSAKMQAAKEAEREARGNEDTFLVKWYKSKIKISSGFCSECGHAVEKRIYQYAINTVCHILAKRDAVCPSVKYHPMNFIILCEHHHDQFDKSSWEELEKWGCWPVVRDRLIMVYPDLAIDERRHFPESVLKYMESLKSF